MLEYSNGWRLSNGKRIFLSIIVRDKETLKEVRRFHTLDDMCDWADNELKLSPSQLKMSRDRRFLFETQQYYIEKLG